MQLQGGVICITHIQQDWGPGLLGLRGMCLVLSTQINKDRSKGGKKNLFRAHIQLKKKKYQQEGAISATNSPENALRQGCDSAVQDSNLQF